MNKKLTAILCLIFGIGVFVAAISAATPTPILRATENSAVQFADYTPKAQAMTIPNSNVYQLKEVQLVGPKHQHFTGNAHVQRSAANESADDSVASPSNGLFSTAEARSYNPVSYHSRVPNVQYVTQPCPLCGTKH